MTALHTATHYQCDLCKEVFAKEEAWTEDDAQAETVRLFGGMPPPDHLSVICDDCFKECEARRLARQC